MRYCFPTPHTPNPMFRLQAVPSHQMGARGSTITPHCSRGIGERPSSFCVCLLYGKHNRTSCYVDACWQLPLPRICARPTSVCCWQENGGFTHRDAELFTTFEKTAFGFRGHCSMITNLLKAPVQITLSHQFAHHRTPAHHSPFPCLARVDLTAHHPCHISPPILYRCPSLTFMRSKSC